jgi:hypothetical protein
MKGPVSGKLGRGKDLNRLGLFCLSAGLFLTLLAVAPHIFPLILSLIHPDFLLVLLVIATLIGELLRFVFLVVAAIIRSMPW